MMKASPLAILIAVGVGFAMAHQPRDAAAPATKAASSNPWSKDYVAVTQKRDWNAGEVALRRNVDGHFYADVTVDGGTAHMLVDTGASVVALTAEDAETLGVRWSSQDVQPVARGASGAVFGVPVTLDRVQLGDLEVTGVQAIVVPEGLPVSLLGQSFLGRVGHVEMGQTEMTLGG